MLKLILLFTILTTLSAQAESWYDKIHPSIEAGMHMSDFGGTISNANSSSDFRDDFDYLDTKSSYFVLGFKFDYDYVPNIEISYFNDKQNKDSTLSKYTEVADGSFDANTTVTTDIDYQVLSFVIYKDFKHKGDRVKFLRWKFYPGDFEFDIGMNLKVINWKFNIKDATSSDSWVVADAAIPLPYIGFKYYYYHFRAYASVSALSFSEATSTNYEIGVDYRVIDNLYLSASYMYEDFKTVEEKDGHRDTVDFNTAGNKFSFKYVF